MNTKQQSPGHRTVVLERATRTPRTETETVEDARPIDHQTGRPTGHSRTIGVAIAAMVLAGGIGLLGYRAIDGSSEPTAPADTSHETAEHQRQLSVRPVANGYLLDSFDLADYVWRQRQAGEDSFDAAEYARMQRLPDEDSLSPANAHADPFAVLADPTPAVSAYVATSPSWG